MRLEYSFYRVFGISRIYFGWRKSEKEEEELFLLDIIR